MLFNSLIVPPLICVSELLLLPITTEPPFSWAFPIYIIAEVILDPKFKFDVSDDELITEQFNVEMVSVPCAVG